MEYIEPMTEIVQYSNEKEEQIPYTANTIYPTMLPYPVQAGVGSGYLNGKSYQITVWSPYPNAPSTKTITVKYKMYIYNKTWNENIAQENGYIANSTAVAIVAYEINGVTYEEEEIANQIGTGYYGLIAGIKGEGQYYQTGSDYDQVQIYTMKKASKSQVKEQNFKAPWGNMDFNNFNGNNWFEWLYSIGKGVINESNLTEILTYDIGGETLLSILISLFPIYMGWCIIKFVIPT